MPPQEFKQVTPQEFNQWHKEFRLQGAIRDQKYYMLYAIQFMVVSWVTAYMSISIPYPAMLGLTVGSIGSTIYAFHCIYKTKHKVAELVSDLL